MNRSTANFVAYDLRPAKQVERRILIDYLACAKEGGLPVSSCRYVGMGGFKFYDFILIHRYVGVRSMISLEHDPKMAYRARYNRPYNFIKVYEGSCGAFLEADKRPEPTIFWLDYDSALTDEVVDDIQTLGTRLCPNSLAFFTVASDTPSDLRKLNTVKRLAALNEQFGVYAAGVSLEDTQDSQFAVAVQKILFAALKNAFAARKDAKFFPDFQISYKDTTGMITIGGHFCDPLLGANISRSVDKNLPFLAAPEVYKIRNLNLSERERMLMDQAASVEIRSRESDILNRLGFAGADIQAYRSLLRFLPRYFEAVL